MSQANVEVIRRLYLAMDARDTEAVADLAHPDLEWIPDERVGEGPVRGPENVIRFFSDRAEMFEDLRTETERVWETGDQILAFVRVTGLGTGSGARFDIRIAHLWTISEGVVVRGQGYGDRDEALRAAGVTEYAMSEENVQVVQALFEATARRDADAARPLLDPNVEWDMSAFPFPDLAGAYRGHDEVFAWWLRYFDAWDECGFEILDVRDIDDEMVVTTRAWGRGRGGIEISRSFANLMKVQDGKLIRNRAFQDQAQALEAVSLREPD